MPRRTSSKRVTSVTDLYQQGQKPEMVGPCKGLSLSTPAAQRNSNRKRPTGVKLLVKGARHISLKVKGLILGLRVIELSVARQQFDPNWSPGFDQYLTVPSRAGSCVLRVITSLRCSMGEHQSLVRCESSRNELHKKPLESRAGVYSFDVSNKRAKVRFYDESSTSCITGSFLDNLDLR